MSEAVCLRMRVKDVESNKHRSTTGLHLEVPIFCNLPGSSNADNSVLM